MSLTIPTAVIVGIEAFGAERLAEELLKNDLRVIGVGLGSSLGGRKNFELWSENPVSFEGIDYVFDFLGEVNWQESGLSNEIKLGLISLNNKNKADRWRDKIGEAELNWRIVEAYGVYGPGMDQRTDEGVEFLVEALRLAVLNQNLVLPPTSEELRLLNINDWVEGVMRAMFLRGTEGESWLLAGEGVSSEEVARALIDQAKMTRVKVILREGAVASVPKERVETAWERLRWRPEIGFGRGIAETLQYFFTKIEEERRTKKVAETEVKMPVAKKYEVIVEEQVVKPVVEDEVLSRNIEKTMEESEEENGEKDEAEEVVGKKLNFEEAEKVEFKIKKITTEPLRRKIEEDKEEDEVIEVREGMENSDRRPATAGEPVNSEQKMTGKVKKIKNLKWMGWVMVGLLWVGMMFWPIKLVLTGIAGVRGVEEVAKLLEEKKYEEAERKIEKSMELVVRADEGIDALGINRLGVARDGQTILRAAKEALLVEEEVGKLAVKGEAMLGGVFGEKEVEWKKGLKELEEVMDRLMEGMGRLSARLSGDWSFLPGKWRSWKQQKARELAEGSRKIALARKGMEVLPELMGLDGKRRDYVVLLQNEMELRPGGGFIGAYGILSWEGGKLLNFEVKDVYEADGQLKGHVEPPEEIKKYLGEAGWFMRDANWQASFPAVSKDIQWFLEKETGRKVDGVVGINLSVVKGILGVVGEIYIPDFKEKINKDNLYEQAEFYSESKFFPGSKQKASFLGVTGKYLFEEIKGLPVEKWRRLIEEIVDKLEENEVQMVLNDGGAKKVLADLGWDGAMYGGECAVGGADKCLADYLYVVEANLGVNKANYFVYRKMEELVDIANSVIGRVVKISYENTAKNNNWPGGDYKNYVRMYLPANVNLAEISVDDGNRNGNKRIYGSNELKIKTVGNKKEIGFLVVVPVGQRRTVEVRYSSGIDLGKGEKFSYLNYIQKQSGFGDTGLVALVSMPTGWQPLQVQPAASVVEGKLLFNMKLNKDIKMGVEIGK